MIQGKDIITFYIYSFHFGSITFVFYPEVVIWRCSLKRSKIHRKAPLPGYLFLGSSSSYFFNEETQAQCFRKPLTIFSKRSVVDDRTPPWPLLLLSDPPILCELNWYIKALAQVFSSEFCEIFNNIIDHLWWLLFSVTRRKTSKYAMTATCNELIVWC